MGLGILLFHIMNVIGGHQPEPRFPGKTNQIRFDPQFLLQPLVLNLQKEAVLSKDVCKLKRLLFCPFIIPVEQEPLYVSSQTGGESDESFPIFCKRCQIDSGFVIEPLGIAQTRKLHQILVTGLIFCQQDQMTLILVLILVLVLHGAGGRIDLAA